MKKGKKDVSFKFDIAIHSDMKKDHFMNGDENNDIRNKDMLTGHD